MPKTRIIAVANLKGGSGKSTLACSLAGELAKHGSTALIDADATQGTSAGFFAQRQQAGKTGELAFVGTDSHLSLIKQVEARTEKFILIDGQPRNNGMTRAMVMISDLVLVPVAASSTEIWSTGDLMALIREANAVRRLKVRGVWSRHRTGKSTAEFATEASAVLKLKFCDAVMSNRISYQTAMGSGLTVCETRDKTAKSEMTALVAEIMKLVK